MPLIKDKISGDLQEKEQISRRVDAENIRANDEEVQTASRIIKKISAKISEQYLETNILQTEEIQKLVQEECGELGLTFEAQKRIEKTVILTALGNGPIEPLLKDPSVTEIVVQRYDNIVVERNGKIEKTDIVFNNEDHLQTIIKRIIQRSGRQINLTSPIADARLSDGSRVNAVIPPVTPDGAQLTIRKFSNIALTGNDYMKLGSLDRKMLYFLTKCVAGKVSIFVSGGTGTGKTTLLNMLSSYIPPDELIITIEDTCELKLQQPNVRRMEVRLSNSEEMMQVDQKTLVKAALRQRPDRIILGEPVTER